MKMEYFWLLPLYMLVGEAMAADASGIPSLSIQDYFIIFIIAIVYLIIFMIAADRIFRIQTPQVMKKKTISFKTIAALFAFILITLGNLLIISTVIIIAAFAMQVEALWWIVEMFRMNLISPLVELALLSGIGLVFYIVGLYTIVHVQGNPFLDRRGMPTKFTTPSKYSIDMMDEEPLNPTLTFKVLDKESDEPVPDVKVILKQMNGIRFYERFTDFNGEVTFQKIEGYGSEYFAYVEGDEKREKYRVIRRQVSAEI